MISYLYLQLHYSNIQANFQVFNKTGEKHRKTKKLNTPMILTLKSEVIKMGLFHKTLKDVEKEFNKGNYKAALKIIEQHINKEHSLRGTFSALNEFYARFTGQLDVLEGALINVLQDKPSKIHQQDFKNSLKGARGYINEMIPYAENFLKLCKEEK